MFKEEEEIFVMNFVKNLVPDKKGGRHKCSFIFDHSHNVSWYYIQRLRATNKKKLEKMAIVTLTP